MNNTKEPPKLVWVIKTAPIFGFYRFVGFRSKVYSAFGFQGFRILGIRSIGLIGFRV